MFRRTVVGWTGVDSPSPFRASGHRLAPARVRLPGFIWKHVGRGVVPRTARRRKTADRGHSPTGNERTTASAPTGELFCSGRGRGVALLGRDVALREVEGGSGRTGVWVEDEWHGEPDAGSVWQGMLCFRRSCRQGCPELSGGREATVQASQVRSEPSSALHGWAEEGGREKWEGERGRRGGDVWSSTVGVPLYVPVESSCSATSRGGGTVAISCICAFRSVRPCQRTVDNAAGNEKVQGRLGH